MRLQIIISALTIVSSVLTNTSFGQGFGETPQETEREKQEKERTLLESRKTPTNPSEELHLLCKNSATTRVEVETLLQNGATALYRDEHGVSPLMSAAYYIKDAGVIEALLKAGAEVNIATSYGTYTPLHCAAFGNQSLEVFSLLLQANANVRAESKSDGTVLHILMEHKPSVELVEFLLMEGADAKAIHTSYKNLWTPLLLTASNNPQKEIIALLLDAGANINDIGNDKNSPIMFALKAKAPAETILYMLERGTHVDQKNKNGITPLHYAGAYSDSIEVIEALLQKGADIHVTSKQGQTPLLYATHKSESCKVLKKLIDAGANIQVSGGWQMKTPLHYASCCRKPEIVKLLIEAGADVNARDGLFSETPLMNATKTNEHIEVLSLLLGAGADVKIINDKGQTALMMTHEYVSEESEIKDAIAKKNILLSAGALMSATDFEGKSVAQYHQYGVERIERMKNAYIHGPRIFIHIREFE